jgi:prolyl-tRNA editing enzyme YbaK/EbsC (Cys-tRNA(Pro) deacylase)
MSLFSVKTFFQALQLDVPILETEANTATVALAAQAHGVEPGRIAKTLAFKLADGRAVLLVARGTPWAACVRLVWLNRCPFF